MVINNSINKTFSIYDSVKNYSCHNVFNEKKYVLTFIQMRTYENKFWQIRNASGNGCVQVRRVKKILQIVMNSVCKVIKITSKFLTCSNSVSNHLWSSYKRPAYKTTSFAITLPGPTIWNSFLSQHEKSIIHLLSFLKQIKFKLLNSNKETEFY